MGEPPRQRRCESSVVRMSQRPFLDIEAVRIELLRTVPMVKPGAPKIIHHKTPVAKSEKKA